MVASDLDLTDVASVRAWLAMPDKVVEFDDALQRLVTACSTTMQRLIGRTIAQASYNHFQDGTGSAFMVLRNTPIARVSSVAVDGLPLDLARVSNDESTLYLSGGLRFARGRNNVQLRYTAGFDETPADLAQVCIETVGLRWKERDRIGHTSKSLAGETTSFSLADFSPTGQTVLDSYKRVTPV
jgi:hypothetical protein